MMFGNPERERQAIERTYVDVGALLRTMDVRPEGSNITRKETVILEEGIKCALSYTGSNASNQRDHAHLVDWDAVLFIAPEVRVYPGDFFQINRLSGRETYTFQVVGKPNIYATHQEIKVVEKSLA